MAETGLIGAKLGLAVTPQAVTLAHPSALAQLVEQLTVNQRVAGSSPAGGAISYRVDVAERRTHSGSMCRPAPVVTALQQIVCYAHRSAWEGLAL